MRHSFVLAICLYGAAAWAQVDSLPPASVTPAAPLMSSDSAVRHEGILSAYTVAEPQWEDTVARLKDSLQRLQRAQQQLQASQQRLQEERQRLMRHKSS